jgi:YD repeat-containing protein
VETVRVEGLQGAQDCAAVTAANASLPAGAVKTSTQWHLDWNLRSAVAEPGQITTWVYNGQRDPFAGNGFTSCTPPDALVGNIGPIAVLCKQVVQATTDANGHLGFGAALQPGAIDTVRTWTYNQYGQVLTAKGSRTDANDTTTTTYHLDTNEDHTVGDVKSITLPTGETTTFTKYNKYGQVLQSTDSNDFTTVNTYDARQRLLSSTVNGRATTYTRDAVGQLTQVTEHDGSWVGFEYDDAHRQTAVKDDEGHRIDYVLDDAGNRTDERVKDPSGALKRAVNRVMDALGRAQQGTGRE